VGRPGYSRNVGGKGERFRDGKGQPLRFWIELAGATALPYTLRWQGISLNHSEKTLLSLWDFSSA
jgi:hypothetical protein